MPSLAATYTSPATSGPENLSESLPAISSNVSTSERVAYLAELQSSIKKLQGSVNTFLTQRMEEEKAAGGKDIKVDDVKEEENYGEEVAEGD